MAHPADESPTEPADDTPADEAQLWIPSLAQLRWPIVQALRDIGKEATDAEIAEHIADAMSLSQQQRTEMIPSGQQTKLHNRVGWAVHELKEIDALYYPRPAYRELTTLGMSIDEDKIRQLRAQYTRSASQSTHAPRSDDTQTRTPAAWFIRSGGKAEFADLFIKNRIAAVGFGHLPDLSKTSSRDEIAQLITQESPELSDAQVSARASQLWTLVSDIRHGDLVVTPSEGSSYFALGRVTSEYWHRHGADTMRHAVSVEWERTDVPRTALMQDLQNALNLRRTINSIGADDAARRLQQVTATAQDPGPRAVDPASTSRQPDLPSLSEQFRDDPTFSDDERSHQYALRTEWATKLRPDMIAALTRNDLTAITNHTIVWGMYLNPVEGEMQWIQDLDDNQYADLLDNIKYLCWGDDELSIRYDRVVGPGAELKVSGFADQNATKLLAICHPEEFLPLGVQTGPWGRERLLELLGLAPPEGATHGENVIDANDRLREHLRPYFGDDQLLLADFCAWLISIGDSPEPPTPDLDDLAKRLLVDVGFLEDIVELLEDKGQVILYGPPGTGKTYLARELAKVLAPDETCRALVQFHPSTSYEDFFEGYRPSGTDESGSIAYELTPGPLARMAQRAGDNPDRRHLMIIDEINRGNLPRVLGELLFLLEYRDERVQTLYRPDDEFSLPKNLWFIGTMNTADRSIALVDAALRRRFHFVPFFPDREPMAGLLGRWLAHEGEPAWIGRLVDAVNDELSKILEGSHLLLGPSHFMKPYGESREEQRERLRRIWEYNIEPFIEDQFFGDPTQIDRFRFNAVMKRHGPPTPADNPDPGSHPRGVALDEGMQSSNGRELWMSRAREFPPSDWPGSPGYHAEMRQVIVRFVEHALAEDIDPSQRDEALVEEFLAPYGYTDSTMTSYRSHLKRWFDWLLGQPV